MFTIHVENDYKLVVLCVSSGNSKQCALYSSKSNSWTQLSALPVFGARSSSSFKMTPSTIVKKCLYWSYSKYLRVPGKVKKGRYMGVFKFVVEKNEFRLLPDFDCSVIRRFELHLLNLRDSLAGMAYTYKNRIQTGYLDIFSLDQEGDGGVWSKLYNVGPVNFDIWRDLMADMFYQCLGEVVYCYDPETNEKKDVVDREALISERDHCFSHMPSLVFIPGMKSMMHLEE